MAIHRKEEQLLDAARTRLLSHMHSLDPSVQASAAMSLAKGDGEFKDRLEAVLRYAVTNFDPDQLINAATAELDT